jgi:hypothetical protein
MASQVVASMNRRTRPAARSQAAALGTGRNPIKNATTTTSTQESAFDTVDDNACPLSTDEGRTGIVRKRLMIPFCMSMASRKAA